MTDCEIVGCEDEVESFEEPFLTPPGVEHGGDHDQPNYARMCDEHHVAARIYAYTREDPPWVDVGLYQEATYYGRALAAATFDLDPMEHVNSGREEDDGH